MRQPWRAPDSMMMTKPIRASPSPNAFRISTMGGTTHSKPPPPPSLPCFSRNPPIPIPFVAPCLRTSRSRFVCHVSVTVILRA